MNEYADARTALRFAEQSSGNPALVLPVLTSMVGGPAPSTNASESTPPSTKPVPPAAPSAPTMITDDDAADTMRTPPVATLEETMKKAA